MRRPAAAREDQRQCLLVVVVDEDTLFGKARLAHERDRALGAALLVAMRGVHENRQRVCARELELPGEDVVLRRRLIVEAYLADRNDALLLEPARQQREDAVDERRIVRLLRVQRQRAEVADAELRRPEPLPT